MNMKINFGIHFFWLFLERLKLILGLDFLSALTQIFKIDLIVYFYV